LDGAFWNCTSLTSISIPSSVTNIRSGAFSGCTNLESIIVDINNLNYSSQDGILFNKDKSHIIQAPAIFGDFIIPDSVTNIGDLAFNGCTALENIIIPNSVTHIGNFAFLGCDNLTQVTLGAGISLGLFAFDGNFNNIYEGAGTYVRNILNNNWTKL